MVLLFVVLFIPMQWGAPAGPARILTYSVPIVPNVSGQVTRVPVRPNTPLSKGDILFEIDPTIFKASVKSLKAKLSFQTLRLEQYTQLAARNAGTRFRVEETEAQVEQLKAELIGAEWNLAQTVVRAPADGYVTGLALRPGHRVVSMPFQPAATFVDTSQRLVVAQIHQIYLRYLEVGQPVEMAFKAIPGRVYVGKVVAVIDVASQGQAVISGTIPPAQQVLAEPFFVRIQLENDAASKNLRPGTVGTATIYTNSVGFTHVIRKVMIRMEAIMNYIIPTL
jgi:RND family efflux transporter MFP subunit